MAVGTYVLYHYDPSFAAAVAGIALFGLITTIHGALLFYKRTWYFTPFVIGGFFETIGYVARAINAKQTPNWSTTPYAIQSLLLLLAPPLFAASIYMILGRIIRLINGDALSLVRPKWLTKTFVFGDVISFLVQSGGGAILAGAKSESKMKLGSNVIIAGLCVQTVFFGFFIIVSAVFHARIVRKPTDLSMSVSVPWKSYLVVLYIASLLIMVRSVFRVAEYIGGGSSVLQQHEYYLYIFDTTLMFLAMVLFIAYHPSRIISSKEKVESIEF